MADSEKIDEKKAVTEQLKQSSIASKKEEKPAPAEAAKEKAAKPAGEKKQETEEKPKKVVLQRVATIPLSMAYRASRSHRARLATAMLREFVARHLKTPKGDVKLSTDLSSQVNARGSRMPPRKLKVMMRKFEDGTVNVEPAQKPEEKTRAPRPAKPAAKPRQSPAPKQESSPKPAAKPVESKPAKQ